MLSPPPSSFLFPSREDEAYPGLNNPESVAVLVGHCLCCMMEDGDGGGIMGAGCGERTRGEVKG